jgi:hypothetical protein
LAVKFSLASGKKVAPGIRSPSASVRDPRVPSTPQNCQTSDQNSSRWSIDHWCSAW